MLLKYTVCGMWYVVCGMYGCFLLVFTSCLCAPAASYFDVFPKLPSDTTLLLSVVCCLMYRLPSQVKPSQTVLPHRQADKQPFQAIPSSPPPSPPCITPYPFLSSLLTSTAAADDDEGDADASAGDTPKRRLTLPVSTSALGLRTAHDRGTGRPSSSSLKAASRRSRLKAEENQNGEDMNESTQVSSKRDHHDGRDGEGEGDGDDDDDNNDGEENKNNKNILTTRQHQRTRYTRDSARLILSTSGQNARSA